MTVFAWLSRVWSVEGKLNEFGLHTTSDDGGGPGDVPVPVRATVCMLPATPLLLSVMVRVPVRVPVAVGEKVTLIVQELLAATLPPQLLVSPKLALAAMLVMVSAALPVLLRVTGCDALVVPTLTLPMTGWPGKVGPRGQCVRRGENDHEALRWRPRHVPVMSPESLMLMLRFPGNALVPAVPAPGASMGRYRAVRSARRRERLRWCPRKFL